MSPPSETSSASSKPYHRGRIWRKGLSLLTVAAGVVWLRPALVRVEGASMSPTLLPGDLLLVARGLQPRSGDMAVVLHPDGFEMVKRVSAAPGDEAMPGWVLGPDEWLVVGDNREESGDSRAFGALSGDSVLARVLCRIPGVRT